MSDHLTQVVSQGIRTFDLGRQLRTGMPQSSNHPQFWHTLPRRHGDIVQVDGSSAANDHITMGTHVGMHIDALAHVSQDGKLYGDAEAGASCLGGKYVEHGVHTIEPMVRRGVLIDVAAHHGVTTLAGGYEITVDDLQSALTDQAVKINRGDVVLIRSGWGALFDEGSAYIGGDTGVPGVGEAAAAWLAEQEIHAAGADTIAFECLKMGTTGHSLFPAHRVLLVEEGIYIIEALNLEAISASGVFEFTLILIPLNIFGATGSPVRPLAVVSA